MDKLRLDALFKFRLSAISFLHANLDAILIGPYFRQVARNDAVHEIGWFPFVKNSLSKRVFRVTRLSDGL